MSSTASVIFLVVGFIWKLKENGQLRYWLGAAFVCYAIASFLAWFRIRPDLRIEIKEIFLESGLGRPGVLEDGVTYFDVIMEIGLFNRHSKNNAIKAFEATVYLSNGKLTKKINMEQDEDTPILKQGRPMPASIPFRFRDVSPDLSLDVRGLRYMLRITDVYDIDYKLKGRLPQEIRMRPR